MKKQDSLKIIREYVSCAEIGLLPARIEKLWGKPHRVRPAYCAKKIGDGKLLLLITPYSERPAYYLIYCDSNWLDPETKRLVEDVAELYLDQVVDAIEEEFGPARYLDDDNEEAHSGWPSADFDNGYEFCLGDESEDFFTPYQLRKIAKLAVDRMRGK